LQRATTERCYYVQSAVFDEHFQLILRLRPARNNQRLRVRAATDYLEL